METTATEARFYMLTRCFIGATVIASAPIGVELHFGGNDDYSSRDVPIFPAIWYSNTYYSPVPTTGRTSNTPRDTAAVMLYNSLSNTSSTINWSSGIPTSGSIVVPPKSVVRFPLGYSNCRVQICKSNRRIIYGYSDLRLLHSGKRRNIGQGYDWAFNLIAQNRLTDFATIAWAPGSLDGSEMITRFR
ncbi:MAG: hypothetical protein IPI88_10720 [Chitinophagaceae bacterium]|nr:hypothetical protein [Chitinophagaceae bacterium]